MKNINIHSPNFFDFLEESLREIDKNIAKAERDMYEDYYYKEHPEGKIENRERKLKRILK